MSDRLHGLLDALIDAIVRNQDLDQSQVQGDTAYKDLVGLPQALEVPNQVIKEFERGRRFLEGRVQGRLHLHEVKDTLLEDLRQGEVSQVLINHNERGDS